MSGASSSSASEGHGSKAGTPFDSNTNRVACLMRELVSKRDEDAFKYMAPPASQLGTASVGSGLLLDHFRLVQCRVTDSSFYFKWAVWWDAGGLMQVQDIIETQVQLRRWRNKLGTTRPKESGILRLGVSPNTKCIKIALRVDLAESWALYGALAQIVLSDEISQPGKVYGT